MSLPTEQDDKVNVITARQTPKTIGLIAVFTVTALLCLPFIRSIFWLGDEGVLLHGATEMLSGKTLYSDFFEFLPPGGFLITEAWMAIFGHSFVSVRLFVILTICGISCFTYLVCTLVSDSIALPIAAVISWVIASQPLTTGVSHHWLTTLLSMAAAWFALLGVRRPDRPVTMPMLAGLLAGAAAMVTSSCGLFAIMAVVLTFTDIRYFRRHLVICVLSSLIIPLLSLAYIILNGSFTAAYDDIVLNTLEHYASIQYVPFGNAASWYYAAKDLFPLTAFLSLVALRVKGWALVRDPSFRACFFFGVAGFLGIYPRPDIYHIYFLTPLVLPLFTCCVAYLTTRWKAGYRYIIWLVVLAYVPSTSILLREAIIAIRAPSIMTAVGPVSLQGTEQGVWKTTFRFIESTPPTDRYFFYPYLPMMPYLMQRQQVSKYDLFTPGYTTPAQYFATCEAVTTQAKWVVLDRRMMNPKLLKELYPAMQNPNPPETRAFEAAIYQSFAFVSKDQNIEIWRRTAATTDKECKNILIQ
jgi:hypothetical protein